MSRIALPFALLLTLSLAACHTPSDSAPSDSTPSDNTPSDSASTTTPAQAPAAENASPTSPASPVADAAKRCDAGNAQSAVGQAASQDVVNKAVHDSGSSTARVIKPGEAVTMDFREDRLNIEVDAGNMVTAVRCG